MFGYFINASDQYTDYPIKKYTKWLAIRKQYLIELDKVKSYYRHREYNYDNSNMLTRLIKTLSRPAVIPVLDYLEYINNDVQYISKQFNITTNLSPGVLHNNVLFRGNSDEIFLYVDNTADPYEMADTWLNYPSIRVIKTDITDVDYPILFRYEKVSLGLSIFEIDIKALMLQYYYWSKGRLLENKDISANIFIPTVIIPNITDSLIDYAIWNRYLHIALDEDILESATFKHPISHIDMTSRIDSVIKDVAKDTLNSSTYITQLLKTIPTMINSDMLSTLRIHKEYFNKQSKWVLWISRLSDIVAIHRTLGKRGYKLNKDLFNSLPYEIKIMLRRESGIEEILGPYYIEVMKENIDYIYDHIGKR